MGAARPAGAARPTGAARQAGSVRQAGAARPAGAARSSARGGSSRPSRSGPGKERPGLAARPRTPVVQTPSASTGWVRGAILLTIVVMLAVTLVPTLRSIIQQRGDTVAAQQRVTQQQQTVADLTRQAALWKDPSYIELQARERLKFVRVGDRAYTVVDATPVEASAAAAERPVVAAPLADPAAPWYGKVWQSIQIADRPTAGVPVVP